MRRKRVFGMTDKMIDNLSLVENDPTFSSLYHIQIGNINSKYSFPGNPCDHSLSSVAEYSPIYSRVVHGLELKGGGVCTTLNPMLLPY